MNTEQAGSARKGAGIGAVTLAQRAITPPSGEDPASEGVAKANGFALYAGGRQG